tara:strand:- start:47 stop:340 length:294 start_codon:yes stop_codon:yes gene_type:complete
MNSNKRIGISLQYTNKKKIIPENTCFICSRFPIEESCLLCNNPICSECGSDDLNYCLYCRNAAPKNENYTAIRVPTEVNQNRIIYVKYKKKSFFCCF